LNGSQCIALQRSTTKESEDGKPCSIALFCSAWTDPCAVCAVLDMIAVTARTINLKCSNYKLIEKEKLVVRVDIMLETERLLTAGL
jgi:hypothetical protein